MRKRDSKSFTRDRVPQCLLHVSDPPLGGNFIWASPLNAPTALPHLHGLLKMATTLLSVTALKVFE